MSKTSKQIYKRNSRFKNHTDVNKYNEFLLELDKKNYKRASEEKPKEPSKLNKEQVNQYVKQVHDEFTSSEYNKPNFSGVSALDTLIYTLERTLDPNYYDGHDYVPFVNKDKDNNAIPIVKKKVDIVTKINNIGDLLSIIDLYPDDPHVEYNINMTTLHKIKEPLVNLNNMIGMKDLKENIVDQIIFYIQNLQSTQAGNDFMHTVIYGPPGTGKTEIAKIIGSIFSKMGILSKGTFRKVTRADLIAGYLGQTALKTRDVIKECLGGVLFIDEAYALGNEEKRDSFSKECIDTLCEALSDHKDNLMVIVAGYETDLNTCFFNYNQGLNSRFTWRFKTEEYSGEDLHNIFVKKVKESGWNTHLDDQENQKIDIKWFEKNKSHFKCFGRDIETLFAKTKIAHSRRIFGLDASFKKIITKEDLDKGLTMYLKNEDNKKKEDEKFKKIISSMYI